MGTDRNAGFRREARGCEKCGFAYLFELLDDYYPAPERGLLRLRRATGGSSTAARARSS